MSNGSKVLKLLRIKVDSIIPDSLKRGEFDFLLNGKESVPSIIKRRTRLGKGVNNSGELERLKPLKPSYIKTRKKAGLSTNTTPNKSNLTLTGSMLDSITGIRTGLKFIFTFFGGTDDIANNKKAEYAKENGRPFFQLSNTEKNGIARKIAAIIRQALRKL